MIFARRKPVAAILLLLIMTVLLTGCWDQREIIHYHILTGTALDVTDDPDQLHILLQVANIKQKESGSGEGNTGSNNEVILLETVSNSLMSGVTEIDRDSNHKLLFQHNQIRVLGIDLAKQGIEKHLDMLLRDPQARLEVPMAVVDGRGEEALAAKLSQEPISGIFLAGMFNDLFQISPKYRVRLIDFVHRLLDVSAAPVMPIIKVTGEDDKQEIKLDGMAVFKKDKMIGRMSNDEALGYIMSFGNVQKCNIEVSDGPDRSVLQIFKLDCKRDVTLRSDGRVRVALSVDAALTVGELYGFKDMKAPALLKHLEKLAQDEIKAKITNSFISAQHLNADIFGFSTMMYQQNPRQWNEIKEQWDEIFADIDFNVQVKTRIPEIGQIVQSLEMEEELK